nr:hypothetical protein [Tanacetum cinerariifolium]
MVELMNQRQKAIAKMKAKVKRDKPLTPAQQKEYMRAFVKNQSTSVYATGWTWKDVRELTDDQLQNVYNKIRRVVDLATAKDHHQKLKRSGETLNFLESKRLKSSHRTEQPAELQETTSVSASAIIAAGDPISVVPFVSVAFSVPAETPIAAGVFTTTVDPETAKQAVPLRKSSWKKSMARRRTLPRPSQSESAALPFDEDDPEAEFKKADGTVKRFSTLRELMHWVGRADLMVLYGMVSIKYKLERAIGIGLGLWINGRSEARDFMLFLLFIDCSKDAESWLEIDRDPSGNDLTTDIQLIQSLLNQLHPAA